MGVPEKSLQQLAPLPKKKQEVRTRQRGAQPGYVLTGEENLKMIQQAEKEREHKEAEKQKKDEDKADKAALMRVQSLSKKQAPTAVVKGPYLGVGPGKLPVMRGQEGWRCLFCKKPYKKELAGAWEDRWVICKSCNHCQHAECMGKARKCVFGAGVPRMK